MPKSVRNFNRQRILDNNYLSLIDKIPLSERDKQIVISYTSGISFTELGREYGITSQRVRQIVQYYILKCVWYNRHIDD